MKRNCKQMQWGRKFNEWNNSNGIACAYTYICMMEIIKRNYWMKENSRALNEKWNDKKRVLKCAKEEKNKRI